ncbi:MAG: hypothetical protein FJ297_17105 [Planctomycetes bacterium]|nr:hypothetical protein [Planctomycetota bacterium]
MTSATCRPGRLPPRQPPRSLRPRRKASRPRPFRNPARPHRHRHRRPSRRSRRPRRLPLRPRPKFRSTARTRSERDARAP